MIDARTQAAIDAGHPDWVALPTSRVPAEAARSTTFFTGRPCKYGHVALRWTAGEGCKACSDAKQKTPEWRDYIRAYQKTPEFREYQRAYQTSPKAREWQRAYEKTPAQREYSSEFLRRRDASKRNATPPWLTAGQIDDMRAIYREAARLTLETGIPHHVDHIVPLTHTDVQGLHVPWNLQVLVGPENMSKSNRFDGTNENESWRAR